MLLRRVYRAAWLLGGGVSSSPWTCSTTCSTACRGKGANGVMGLSSTVSLGLSLYVLTGWVVGSARTRNMIAILAMNVS